MVCRVTEVVSCWLLLETGECWWHTLHGRLEGGSNESSSNEHILRNEMP